MKPQTVRSRATRTLAKMDSFSFATPTDVTSDLPLSSSESGALVGRLKYKDGEHWIVVLENGIFLSEAKLFAPYRSMRRIRILETTVETARTIHFELDGRLVDFCVDTRTGNYKDIFDVLRFLLRCAEDSAIRRGVPFILD